MKSPSTSGRSDGPERGRSRRGAAQLILFINRKPYFLRRIQPYEGVAWRMMAVGGTRIYDVHDGPDGVSCDCWDYLRRRQHDPAGCKHIAALRAVQLLRFP
jgi:hypothetical protein